MKWIYEVEYLDGVTDNIPTQRLSHPGANDVNIVIHVEPHGHDNRYNQIVIPLANVRRYKLTEVL